MIIMPSNNLSGICHFVAGRYPGKVGMLNTPFSWKTPPPYMPWAFDNGCFKKWDEALFLSCLKWSEYYHPPLWVVVPDVVGDHKATLELWHQWNKRIPYRLAFACQDGCEPKDVPMDTYCCFIGGSTAWKLANAQRYKGITPWLHIGRVTTGKRLRWAEGIGADSVDGTGFFRGNGKQRTDLLKWWLGDNQLCLPLSI